MAVEPLRKAGVELDLMLLLDIVDMRGYREAKKAINDPNVKSESIPLHWQNTVFGIQKKKLKKARERTALLRERQKKNERTG